MGRRLLSGRRAARRRTWPRIDQKVPFVAAVEMSEVRPQRLRFDPVAGFSVSALAPWARQPIPPSACFPSDGLSGFAVLDQFGYEHNIRHATRGKTGSEIDAFRWLNVVLAT
ncbi:transposase [Janthinobacterium sp. RB2R34]|uniref:transposase n=1 Tax=Janthinobacterium sp. RB2R34 TaxID=3424193 RepID=UPI003F221D96